MRFLLIVSFLLLVKLTAADVKSCQSCHPTIYQEFQHSFHKQSSIKEDKVHNAVWKKHPASAKGNYTCAKCHTSDNQAHQGITCITCHTITDIETHPQANKNIYETKLKTFYSAQKGSEDKKLIYHEKSSWFGLVKETTGSPYHDIDYTNENYYTGKMCMGCHSHKQNAHGFDVCRTEMSGAESKEENCISCHMPQINGSSTTIKKTKTHAFHGFAGVRNTPEMLAKYIDIQYNETSDAFVVTVENMTPHSLLTHPLRVVQLKTILTRGEQKTMLQTHTFTKTIGTDNKPSMPWLATQIVEDTMIKANEKRTLSFDQSLQSGDELEVVLGYYIVNPKAAEKLGLENEKELTEFKILKTAYFKIQ